MPIYQRTQTDELQDEFSHASGIDTGTDTPTRQEFKDEADLNILLARFGVTTDQQRPMTWGQELDYNMDLQQAIQLLHDARAVEKGIPPELRDKYATWFQVVSAIESGEYEHDLNQLKADKAAKEQAVKDARELADFRKKAEAPQNSSKSGDPTS